MALTILFATRNAHKISEVKEILAPLGLDVRSLDAFPDLPEPPEDGDTFVANALQKARFVAAQTGMVAVADDSGLAVDALGGRPGVHSKRFTPEARADTNNARLLRELAGVDDRGARFCCAIALVGPSGEGTAEGTCEGRILRSPGGEGGFGYDPLFEAVALPGRSLAQVSAAEKNAVSHRGEAFRQLPGLLRAQGLLPDKPAS